MHVSVRSARMWVFAGVALALAGSQSWPAAATAGERSPTAAVPDGARPVRVVDPSPDFLPSAQSQAKQQGAEGRGSVFDLGGAVRSVSGAPVAHAYELPDPSQRSITAVGPTRSDATVRSAAVTQRTLAHKAQVCDGPADFQVQVVYAHTTPAPNVERINEISNALENVDKAFTVSALRTGGSRRVRWANVGAPTCEVKLTTAQITTGATDFDALIDDLVSQGAVAATGTTFTKYLVFTEGQLTDPVNATCGIGENYPDDRALNPDKPNDNLLGTLAAVDLDCWDIADGGSVPAHELMHTLGAVQDSAPHEANSGHCYDEYDLLCYGPGMQLRCSNQAYDAQFDCNNDDYFHTDPTRSNYLCAHWNTADSLYLQGWDTVQPPRAVTSLTATAGGGGINVRFAPTASCYGADGYRVDFRGLGAVNSTNGNAFMNVPARIGSFTYTVTVTPYAQGRAGTSRSTTVMVRNEAPRGGIVLSLTDGRGYGMLAWAMDPETGSPVRMRVTVEGVSSQGFDWNYTWADMPRYTGVNRNEALVFLAQLPPGTRNVCFDARDPQSGTWTNVGCRSHTVK